MNFGSRLKDIRAEKKLTQQTMAELLHMDRSNYSRYETNEQKPNADLILRIAEQFEKDIDWLYGHEKNHIHFENGSANTVNGVVDTNNNFFPPDALDIINRQMKVIESQVETSQQQTAILQKLIEKVTGI